MTGGRRRGRGVAASLAAMVLLVAGVLGTGPATAATDTVVSIRAVDTTDFPQVRITTLATGSRPAASDFTVRENGELVASFDVFPTGSDTGLSTVLVLDVSGSMADGDAIASAREAAAEFVRASDPETPIALVAFGDQARLVSNFSTNHDFLVQAIGELVAAGETALWDGVRMGAALYGDRPDLQANLVVLSDGTDTTSTSTEDEAIAAVKAAHATAFTVGVETTELDAGSLQRLASDTGGSYAGVRDPGGLAGVYQGVQESLANQYDLVYTSTSEQDTLELAVAAGGAQASATVNTGTKSVGASANPEVVSSSGGIFGGSLGLVLGVGAGVVAAALAAAALVLVFQKDDGTLDARLSHYEDTASAAEHDADEGAMFQTPMMARAVTFTEDLARERGVLPKVERALEKADLPLRAAEALFFYVATAAGISLAGLLLAGSLISALIVGSLAFLLPPGIVSFLGRRRQAKFLAVLPDTLELLASSLRAGYSLMQGVEAVSQEAQEPMGKELRRVVAEARLGRKLEESLEDVAERMQSDDFAWAVMAIRIQREVGGNLSELLQTVGSTMLARERLRREVKSLTAEGRMSAIVLGILPVGLGLTLKVMNPEYVQPLLTETTGQIMLGGSILLAVFGFWWMWKIIQIDV